MRVSVIVPYFEPPVKGCIESIQGQTYQDIELVKISEKELGITERKGAGFMRNAGAERATGDILLFLDSDAVLTPDAVQKMVAVFQATGADAVSGLPLTPRRAESDLLNYLLGLEYEERIRAMGEGWVDVSATTALGIKRPVFQEVGGFVTEFTRGIGEDWIFSHELTQKGFTMW
ncbi:MAG: glycosyltransferase family 2 protein, partial [Dehalococcoidia bacterium]|nr:glycosyltransferase family 2 protein [Dehalococcoidia bacterium]